MDHIAILRKDWKLLPKILSGGKTINPEFFNFKIDSKTSNIIMIYSIDDDLDVLESVKFLKNNLNNVQCVEFKDKGHFVLNSLKTEEFPELLSLILE